jgi:hypothetical protein
MASRKDDKFSMYIPPDDTNRRLPAHLEVLDTGKGGKPKQKLTGGAYDPYQKTEPPGPAETARIRKPRVDLRQLSQWIEVTRRVKSLREEDLPPGLRPEPDKPRK